MANRRNAGPSLPSKADFVPYEGCLDAECAWDHFGGHSVDEAYVRFCDNPRYYQEDFMFMGGIAFAYYFSVVERYVRESHVIGNDDEVEAMWILAHCIIQQFSSPNTDDVRCLQVRAAALVTHVRGNLQQYATDKAEQERIDSAWAELEALLTD